MKYQTGIIISSLGLLFLFTALLRGADPNFPATAGSKPAEPEIQGQIISHDIENNWDADTLRGRKQKESYYSQNRSSENNPYAPADVSVSRKRTEDAEANLRSDMDGSISPFQQYMLAAIAFGGVGLVLIAVGAVQWRVQRSIRQKWLFPTVQDDFQASSPAPTPSLLITKKPQEESPAHEQREKRSIRRAA